jgi:hypothetical protein
MAGDDVAKNAVETAARTRASSAAIDCSKASAATAFMNTHPCALRRFKQNTSKPDRQSNVDLILDRHVQLS